MTTPQAEPVCGDPPTSISSNEQISQLEPRVLLFSPRKIATAIWNHGYHAYTVALDRVRSLEIPRVSYLVAFIVVALAVLVGGTRWNGMHVSICLPQARPLQDPRCTFCTRNSVGGYEIIERRNASNLDTIVLCRGGDLDLRTPKSDLPADLPFVCTALCLQLDPLESVFPSKHATFAMRSDSQTASPIQLPTDIHLYGYMSRSPNECEERTLLRIGDSRTAQQIAYSLLLLHRNR